MNAQKAIPADWGAQVDALDPTAVAALVFRADAGTWEVLVDGVWLRLRYVRELSYGQWGSEDGPKVRVGVWPFRRWRTSSRFVAYYLSQPEYERRRAEVQAEIEAWLSVVEGVEE